VEESGGDYQNLALYGQDNNGGVWAICKINSSSSEGFRG
jgi:type I restriction enzyme M protein